jgi:Fe-S cluster assembly iron-binding protein IscA
MSTACASPGRSVGREQLRISTADGPEEGDQVVEQDGARVFLTSRVADALDDKVLDASVGDQGRIGFLISSL